MILKYVICVLCMILLFIWASADTRVKSKIKHKLVAKDKKQLSQQEIDPNISPNPLPVNDDALVSVANDDPIVPATNSDDTIVAVNDTISDTIPVEMSDQSPPLNHDDESPISKYCDCSDVECNCCRDFKLPIVPVRGPGCAKVKYLGNEKMSVSIKYGDITLASRVISGKKTTPICVPLPGGYSSFCGKIYGLGKVKNDFKACLGLELRAEDEIEAALRVSCFKFGNKGLSLTDAEPLPPPENEKDEDDYDFFGLGGDDDSGENEEATGAQSEEADYDGFSLLGGDLLEGIFGGGSSARKKQ